jgi:hypothetical protein
MDCLVWNATGTTSLLLTETLSTSYKVSGLTGGNVYKFKVTARNIYGSGSPSDELSIEASDRPDKPSIPVVSLAGTNVKIQWQLPN